MRISRFKIVFISILLVTVFHQCTDIKLSGAWINEHISQDIRAEIKQQNGKLMKSVLDNDFDAFKQLMAGVLIQKEGSNLQTLFDQMRGVFKSTDYKVMDEFYFKTAKDASNTAFSGDGDHAYQLSYQAGNKEMYASLIFPGGLHNELLFVLIYGKYGNEWKLNIFHCGQYSMFGKTAPDCFNLAKKSYREKRYVDALMQLSIANVCINPGDKYFHYKIEDDMKAFQTQMFDELNKKYNFPILLDRIPTKPQIFSLNSKILSDGCHPVVGYVSKIDIADTVALRKEYEAVASEAAQIFKGIDQNRKYVLYQVSNEIPDGKKMIKTFGFVYEVE